MEAKPETEEVLVVDQSRPSASLEPDAHYISPEVLLAQAGARVEMGKNVTPEQE